MNMEEQIFTKEFIELARQSSIEVEAFRDQLDALKINKSP
jgi:hypothetical protein